MGILTAFAADSFHEVTIFHPNRPPVRWSKVENLFATTYGASYEVEVVIANPRFLVTDAIAEIGWYISSATQLDPRNRLLTYNRRVSHGILSAVPNSRFCRPLVCVI